VQTAAPLAIVDVNVVDVMKGETRGHQTVVIADGRIGSASSSDAVNVPTQAIRGPGQGRYLISDKRYVDFAVPRRRTQYKAAQIKRVYNIRWPLNFKPGGCYAPARVSDRCPDLGPDGWLPQGEKCRGRRRATRKLR
jgi:hypothetical protein